ncbi:elongation of very long chain fatty acids protein-like [Penaeus japonicus]|uniref:elongation of very long chain fatty acids protein-like n=1 Tax=Penaeus japonicus TaxID=27405 RepID=UPI001C70C61A|nr:elongation of very long chain fatty acids protein-like [Penaeus japonicus]
MAPCQNTANGKLTPETQATEHKEKFRDEEEGKLTTLRRTTKFGVAVTLANFFYGHFLVASNQPKDPRQDSWLLTQSPLPTVALSLTYVLGVTWIGPRLMAKRKPFEGLRSLMVAYNAFQVVYSAWLVYELGMGGWFGSYSFRCQECDFSDDPMAVRMMHASYWYYFSKFVDFLDTIFFVLHKKYEHISLLHVCHHSLMPVSMWYGVRYQAGGHNTLMGLLNSFVHVVMYGYYFLAAMGPKVRPYLWWKKHVTTLQMIQFITVIIHALQLTVIDCPGVPRALNLWVTLNALMFLGLFADFYVKSYRAKKASAQLKAKAGGSTRVSEAPLYSKIPSKLPPNSVAGTAYQTMDMCEKMALRSRLGAI